MTLCFTFTITQPQTIWYCVKSSKQNMETVKPTCHCAACGFSLLFCKLYTSFYQSFVPACNTFMMVSRRNNPRSKLTINVSHRIRFHHGQIDVCKRRKVDAFRLLELLRNFAFYILPLTLCKNYHHHPIFIRFFLVSEGGRMYIIPSAIYLTPSLHLARSVASSTLNPFFF